MKRMLSNDEIMESYYDLVKMPQNYTWEEMAFLTEYPKYRDHPAFKQTPNNRLDAKYPNLSLTHQDRVVVIETEWSSYDRYLKPLRFQNCVSKLLVDDCLEATDCPFKALFEEDP